MTSRRGRVILAGGVAALGLAAGAVYWQAGRGGPSAATATKAGAGESELARGLRRGEAESLVAFEALAKPTPAAGPDEKPKPKPVAAADAERWIGLLIALRDGFIKLPATARARAVGVATAGLDRFAAEPAPPAWLDALAPVHNVLTLALADPDQRVRVEALDRIAGLWTWAPGCDLVHTVEVERLAAWKEEFHVPVLRCLGHVEPEARAAAARCLAGLPLDGLAAPAIPLLQDKHAGVRAAVLYAFAARPALLTEEAILPVLHDPRPEMSGFAATLLKQRGLTDEQVALCKLIAHPTNADLRASAIPLLKGRSDIDPIMWLVHLSRDPAESVRLRAIEAMADRVTPEVAKRLEEMSGLDPSPAVRTAAAKLLPPREATASLPPLPGSPSLYPKAN